MIRPVFNDAVRSERHNSDDSSSSPISARPLVSDASGVAKTWKWKVSRDVPALGQLFFLCVWSYISLFHVAGGHPDYRPVYDDEEPREGRICPR
jgi:hypothetical protein